MSFAPGSRVGPYEVVGPLGAGGMGEVLRARDARLKRDVALKVLPLSSVGNADSRARFDREAQVLASLSHPAIAQIFGVEIAGGAPVIVMELIEGPTLDERLAGGALPLAETLAIAAQLCDGLEAAHERGVIHRDLKPANIKAPPDGTIKILDFGLARVLTPDTGADTANSPTMLGRTSSGIILGTAAYMSPEQARGRDLDKRTDIWSFGCILYEMLTGAPAFDGESATDILAGVVGREPDFDRLPAGTPARLVELVRHCLQKHPKDRLRDIADARFAIEQVQRGPIESRASAEARPARQRLGPRSLGWFTAGAGAAAAVALLIAGVPFRKDAAAPAPVRTTIALPPGVVLALGRGSAVALSPDGRTLVFAGRANSKTLLYVRALDRFDSHALSGTDGATNPFFSPDGRWVGFFADGKLKKVSLEGGAPVVIADVLNSRGQAWGAGDDILFTPSNSAPVWRVPARGGKPEALTALREGELSHRWPGLLPDGRTMLFSVWNDAGWEPSRIVGRAADGVGQSVVIEAGGGYPRYVRDADRRGYLVYARSEGLLAAPLDETTLTVTGQAVPLVDGVITNLSGGAHSDLSASGTLAYVPGGLHESARELVWVTRQGKASPGITMRGLTRTWKLSPDGTRVVRNNAGGPGDIWIENLEGGRSTRITNSPERGNFNGVWSGDGQFVVFARGFGNTNLFRRPADGRDVEQRLTSNDHPQGPMSVSPDGRWLAFYDIDPVSGSDIWVLPLPAGPIGPSGDAIARARPFVKTNDNEGYAVFSPDSRWMAYQSNDSGRFEIFVRAFPDGQQVFRVSADGGISPTWSPTGDELFYRGLNGKMMAVAVRTDASFEAGKQRELFDALPYESIYSVSADGERLLMMPLIVSEQSATQINLVLNFLTELRPRIR
ncbi:MAG: protein kinase [Vicinamibacterales bacterium]